MLPAHRLRPVQAIAEVRDGLVRLAAPHQLPPRGLSLAVVAEIVAACTAMNEDSA
ncbi:hypothetical protein AB0M39_01560 [Streptomyces sp. NPDC051907]|uniref:hypothetical protein n=1 Tax=Streptomyces sp. NPDC051907 TaxID=3155284 RepID=UPI003424A52A